MLIENNYIQDLDVSENKIGKKGSDALFQMLLENTTVQKIGILTLEIDSKFLKFKNCWSVLPLRGSEKNSI